MQEPLEQRLASLEHEHGVAALARVRQVWDSIRQGHDSRDLSGDLLQRPKAYYFPELRANPWWTGAPELSDVAEVLEANAAQMRAEALNARKAFGVYVNADESVGSQGGIWSTLIVREKNQTSDAMRAHCPKTAEVLESIPSLRDIGMFSAVNPGAHIVPHCGPWNTRVTMHLGLVVPDDCSFRVGAETRTWQEGKCLAFDDSFEHEVWNRSDKTRLVLLVDFWHPDLTPVETVAIEEIINKAIDADAPGPAPQEITSPWWVE